MKALVLRLAVFAATSISLSISTPALADDNDSPVQQTILPHKILPHDTDPAIQGSDLHYVWFNPSRSNHQLLVYLPGNGGTPGAALKYQARATALGYHVIGLAYETRNSLSALCNMDPDPNACFYDAHFEVTYGVGSRLKYPVNVANSIVHRLTALLHFLATNPLYAEEGWSHFLVHGSPKWSVIALSGLSQGAGNAAMIAKYTVVPRVVMLSGVTDRLSAGRPECDGSTSWLVAHRTPTTRYWGLVHKRDPGYLDICANWDSIGITRLGQFFEVQANTAPDAETHQLFTDLLPQGGYSFAHPSIVRDQYTPVNADGSPKLGKAWDYLLTADADDGAHQHDD